MASPGDQRRSLRHQIGQKTQYMQTPTPTCWVNCARRGSSHHFNLQRLLASVAAYRDFLVDARDAEDLSAGPLTVQDSAYAAWPLTVYMAGSLADDIATSRRRVVVAGRIRPYHGSPVQWVRWAVQTRFSL